MPQRLSYPVRRLIRALQVTFLFVTGVGFLFDNSAFPTLCFANIFVRLLYGATKATKATVCTDEAGAADLKTQARFSYIEQHTTARGENAT